MTPTVNISICGWSAHLSAAATILTFVTGILFFSGGKSFGKINDLFSVFQVLLMIPLVFFFSQLITPPSFLARFISSAFGLGGILVNVSLIGARTLPTALIWIGIAAGVGYLLIVGGFIKGGQRDPIFYGGSLLLGVCYPIWGIWLGKLILVSLG